MIELVIIFIIVCTSLLYLRVNYMFAFISYSNCVYLSVIFTRAFVALLPWMLRKMNSLG